MSPLVRHGQIQAALKRFARITDQAPQDVYNVFFRELFLADLMAQDSGWVIKGGTNLYCRIPGARFTQDLDLYRQDDPTQSRRAAEELVRIMDGRKLGPYIVAVLFKKDRPSGAFESTGLRVEIKYGAQAFYTFNIDVSGDLAVPPVTETIKVNRSVDLDLDFAERVFEVRSYPIENQLADKVAAMFEIHGTRTSTRYRDLFDICLIAINLEVDYPTLQSAVNTQINLRKVLIPTPLVWPDQEWPDKYSKFARTITNSDPRLVDPTQALQIAALLLEPVVERRFTLASPTWNPVELRWT